MNFRSLGTIKVLIGHQRKLRWPLQSLTLSPWLIPLAINFVISVFLVARRILVFESIFIRQLSERAIFDSSKIYTMQILSLFIKFSIKLSILRKEEFFFQIESLRVWRVDAFLKRCDRWPWQIANCRKKHFHFIKIFTFFSKKKLQFWKMSVSISGFVKKQNFEDVFFFILETRILNK